MNNIYSNIDTFFRSHVAIDTALLERLKAFRLRWTIKKAGTGTNLDFLSGITMGVQRVRFSSEDEDELYRNVFRINGHSVQKDLYRVDGIDKNWKVSRNLIYQLLLFTMREIYLQKMDQSLILEAYYIMAYKMISSMIYRRFSNYDLDPRIANSVSERMSNRFILKEEGSWQKYFRYRATFVESGSTIHKTITTNYNTENSILILNELQGAIKSTVIRIYSLTKLVIEEDGMIDSNTIAVIENEEVTIGDLKDSYVKYSSIAFNKFMSTDMVNDNYIYLLTEISPNLNATVFKTMLSTLNARGMESINDMRSIVDDIIKYSISYLVRTDTIQHLTGNIIIVMKALRSYYSSSTIKDSNVVNLKKRSLAIVEDNTTSKTPWIVTTMNLNLILYVFLLGIIKH